MQETFDVSNYDKETIHIPGKIQPHGFLLAVSNQEFIITHISNNIHGLINISVEQLLNKPLADFDKFLRSAGNKKDIQPILHKASDKYFDNVNPALLNIDDKIYNLIVTLSADKFLLEFEMAGEENEESNLERKLGKAVSELINSSQISNLLNRAVIHIRNLIKYDRIIIYKFSEDGHGEVVAEDKKDQLNSFMGLHFPASYIPTQAREHYKRQPTRMIADVNACSSDIITHETNSLDLAFSELKAASPVRIEYLKNMDVSASFNISLEIKDKLWGLIICHNQTPKFIEYAVRQTAKLIGKILSYSIEFKQQEEDNFRNKNYHNAQQKMIAELRSSKNIEDVLIDANINIGNIMDCGGAALVFENKVHLAGITPVEGEIKQIAEWLNLSVNEPIFYSNKFSKQYEAAQNFAISASGIIAATISKEPGEYILWFRPEVLRSINWAGDLRKAVDVDHAGTISISQGKSFETWAELISSSCEPWTGTELSAAKKIIEEVNIAVNRKSSETKLLNEKLKYAYDELDSFSYTISHDLKNPLAVIKSYLEILEYNKELDERTKGIVKRILSSAIKMNSLIKEVLNYSQIGRSELKPQSIDMKALLQEVKTELLISLKSENLVLEIRNTPSVHGELTMISQVFNNLLSNAIKYSVMANPSVVIVNGEDDGSAVTYSVTDNGIGIDEAHHSKIFGLFTRLEQAKNYEGLGVGLAIVKRMVEKHNGKIWLQSKQGHGATFFLQFPNLSR